MLINGEKYYGVADHFINFQYKQVGGEKWHNTTCNDVNIFQW